MVVKMRCHRLALLSVAARCLSAQQQQRMIVAPGSGQRVDTVRLILDAERAVCVSVGQKETCLRSRLIEITGLELGKHVVSVRDDDERKESVEVEIVDGFEPTYRWRECGDEVPAGLDVRLPLDGKSPKQAKIPEPFRMQKWFGFFWRVDVFSHSTVTELESDLAEKLGIEDVELFYGASRDQHRLHPDATAAQLNLFSNQDQLKYK